MVQLNRINLAVSLLKSVGTSSQPQLDAPLAKQVSHMTELNNVPLYLEEDDNVLGLGVGFKSINDSADSITCVKIYLREHEADDEFVEGLHSWFIESGIGYIPIDFEVVGEIELSRLDARQRPVLCGYSVGHHQSNSGGSIGCLVRKRDNTDEKFLLSNSHVIAQSGCSGLGEEVIQPCIRDGGTPGADRLTELYAIADLRTPPSINFVDAAIAGPLTQNDCLDEIAILGIVPQGVQTNITLGMQAKKVGCATELTDGRIVVTDFYLKSVWYDDLSSNLKFDNLVIAEYDSDRGDSGALVLDENNYAIGLNTFRTHRRSFFSPIQTVCDELNVDIVTQIP